jgi:hypothetical protein
VSGDEVVLVLKKLDGVEAWEVYPRRLQFPREMFSLTMRWERDLAQMGSKSAGHVTLTHVNKTRRVPP